jgi:hypothetical protein
MAISLVEPGVVLLVDQVSMLTSPAESPSELRLSSHIPTRLLFLEPGGGFAKCEMDGRCALERRSGNEFCDLANAEAGACDIGDCISTSPGKGRTLGVQEVGGDVCDRCVARSSALGRYRGLRIGHEIPACSRMSVLHQQHIHTCHVIIPTTFWGMLK